MKTLQEIESILRDQKPILKQKFGVLQIGIFGSFVRGEQKDTSDLDLLIDFEEPIGLIRYVGLFERQNRRAGGPGHKVRPQTENRRAYPERGNLRMKERDYGSYIEDIILHMDYAREFIKYIA